MQIPDTEAPTRDLLALINTSHTKQRIITMPDGKEQQVTEIDNEGIFWQTQNVSSPYFGAFVKKYKDLESLKDDCYNHMSPSMARVFAGQLERAVQSYRSGIEGKSSETVLDHNNNKQNLIDKIKENKQTNIYRVKEDVKKSMFDGFFGKKVQDDAART